MRRSVLSCWVLLLACVAVLPRAQAVTIASDAVLPLPPDGRLSVDSFIVAEGASVSFAGSAPSITITAFDSILIEGALYAGPRSLTLEAGTVRFGPEYFLTGSTGSLDIHAATFDGGPRFNPRGSIFVNRVPVASSPLYPFESYGAFESVLGTVESYGGVQGVAILVPEPQTVVLLLAGVVALAATARRRPQAADRGA